ncbi:lactate racemase domain-containing protein [Oleispirillum naphthae]|uniref:lactate racemase domain-containing protein n=1 Tax=Oleispirillum naphthae TaxID=2838853 RepID=UPI0030825E9F
MTPRYVQLLKDVALPPVALVRQTFPVMEAGDVAAAVHEAMAKEACCDAAIKPGMRIALTVGSRGLASLPELTRAIAAEIRARGGEPFIVPSMGSHGGATAEGQVKMLAHLGVTEESAGCPIRSSMETVNVGTLENGMEVHVDKLAYEADGIVVFNRVKPHTEFRGDNESGLIKMLAIGLGKQSGADNCHAWGSGYLARSIVDMGRMKLDRCKILFGVATLENAYDRLARVVVLPAQGMIERERPLLAEAMRAMPRLPLGPLEGLQASGPLDVLVLDQVGKEFSGSGMDPNITGRVSTPAISGGPEVARIAVLDVSDHSEGNAVGIGMADVITQRLFDKFDREPTYINCITLGTLTMAGLPMTMPNDWAAIAAAVKSCASHTPSAITLIRAPNSLHLQHLYVSEALLPSVRERPGIEVVHEPRPMGFDAAGNLADPWPERH